MYSYVRTSSQCIALLCWLLPCRGQDFGAVKELIRSRMVADTVPSIAVAVARNGKIVWEEGFGWADRERRVPATQHTPYSMASISKPITATGLMTLVQAGKLKLDDPINRYLGAAKLTAKTGNADDATIRRVAGHTAGLPLHYQFFYEDEAPRPPPMEETIRRYGLLVTPPGERYEYSNLGFGILDYVISRVSGKPYEEFMRTEVFGPLGLTRTAVGIPPGCEREQAIRYGTDQLPIPFYDFDHRGASAIYSSAHDLVRFGMFHLKAHLEDQKQILSDASIDAMQKTGDAGGRPVPYGVGWSVVERGGKQVVSHTGGMGGVSTILTMIPADGVAVVALCNASSSLPMTVSARLLSLLSGLPSQVRIGGGEAPAFPPPELVRTWHGKLETHTGEQSMELRVLQSGDVHVRLDQGLWTLLNRPSYGGGYLTGVMMGDVRTEDASRRPHVIQLTLKLRNGVLNGPASAVSTPGKRAGNALTSWVELH